jgi:hypothetical protein
MSTSTADRRGIRRGHKVEQPEQVPAATDPVVAGVVGAVSQAERQHLSWARVTDGSETEEITAASLDILGRFGWTAQHQRRWPGLPDIEDVHVAVGPGGIAVVSERIWTGHVVVEGDVVRHNGFRCDRDIERLTAAVDAVKALLPAEHRDAVVGVIHVTPRDMPSTSSAGILVVGRMHLASMLVDLPLRLTPMDVADIARWLQRAVDAPGSQVANSGGGAVSTGTVFYPSMPGAPETAAYFSPRQPSTTPTKAPSVTPATGTSERENDTWALLYPSTNRFGIR